MEIMYNIYCHIYSKITGLLESQLEAGNQMHTSAPSVQFTFLMIEIIKSDREFASELRNLRIYWIRKNIWRAR